MLTSTSALYYENTVFCHADYVTNLSTEMLHRKR